MANVEYVADFETTSVRRYKNIKIKGHDFRVFDQENSEAFVCAWGLAPIEAVSSDEVWTGRSIEQFLDVVEAIAKKLKKRDKLNVFTHNLKFDGAFILWHCLYNKYGEVFDEVRDNSLYNFSVKFPSGVVVTFRDSSKIFTSTVAKLGETYGIKKLMGDWDYEKYRDETTEISPEEWEYVKHDVLIVCKALHDYRSKGYKQNTAASIAYNQRLNFTYPKFNKSFANKFKKSDYELFRSKFPFDIMPLPEDIHTEIMGAYYGGWTYLNPHYAEKTLLNISSFDENSMYPDKMANSVLPIGQPTVYENPDEDLLKQIRAVFPCIIYRIKNLTLQLKDEWSLPMLMFETDYKTSVRSQGKVITCKNELCWLTNYDYEMMMNEYYVLDGQIEKVFAFNGKAGQYKEYVDYWMGVKAEHTILAKEAKSRGDFEEAAIHNQIRNDAKLMLNSPYGKDGTKIYRMKKTSYMSENGLLATNNELEKSDIEYYLPSAIFICATARYNLYEALKVAGKSFIYSDTDSLKVTKKGRDALYEAAKQGMLVIDDAELGAWKDEALYDKAKFVRQKTYATLEDGEWHYTVCGAPDSVKQAFKIDDFKRGMVISLSDIHKYIDPNTGKPCQGKLLPISVKGGVILEECAFQIANQEDWNQFTPDNLPIHNFVKFMRTLPKYEEV